jgi:hypothetical protein
VARAAARAGLRAYVLKGGFRAWAAAGLRVREGATDYDASVAEAVEDQVEVVAEVASAQVSKLKVRPSYPGGGEAGGQWGAGRLLQQHPRSFHAPQCVVLKWVGRRVGLAASGAGGGLAWTCCCTCAVAWLEEGLAGGQGGLCKLLLLEWGWRRCAGCYSPCQPILSGQTERMFAGPCTAVALRSSVRAA